MSTSYFIKKAGCLVPSDSGTKNRLAKIPNGTVVRAKLNVARNPEFHKKVMALLQIGFENQDHYSDFDIYRTVMKYRIGSVDTIEIKGIRHYAPKKWDFDSMDDLEFQDVFKRVYAIIRDDLQQLTETNELDKAIMEVVHGFMDEEERAKRV